jgi:hypothetical protein
MLPCAIGKLRLCLQGCAKVSNQIARIHRGSDCVDAPWAAALDRDFAQVWQHFDSPHRLSTLR